MWNTPNCCTQALSSDNPILNWNVIPDSLNALRPKSAHFGRQNYLGVRPSSWNWSVLKRTEAIVISDEYLRPTGQLPQECMVAMLWGCCCNETFFFQGWTIDCSTLNTHFEYYRYIINLWEMIRMSLMSVWRRQIGKHQDICVRIDPGVETFLWGSFSESLGWKILWSDTDRPDYIVIWSQQYTPSETMSEGAHDNLSIIFVSGV